jgi:GNAT superfamily N-acetyltransferase
MPAWRVDLTHDPALFAHNAVDFLRRDPVRNTVVLSTVVDRLDGAVEDAQPAYFACVRDGRQVVGAAMRTPGRAIYLTDMPAGAIDAVVDAFAEATPDAHGVDGPVSCTTLFARRWSGSRGTHAVPAARSRLYQLATLRAVAADGQARPATVADADLCLAWLQAFTRDIGDSRTPPDERRLLARLSAGRIWLWHSDERPVAMVGHTPVIFGVARIAPVYTPPPQRRHGYASALTSHVSDVLRESGAQPCLFTDLANPTTNHIYPALGYRPVLDQVAYHFH